MQLSLSEPIVLFRFLIGPLKNASKSNSIVSDEEKNIETIHSLLKFTSP